MMKKAFNSTDISTKLLFNFLNKEIIDGYILSKIETNHIFTDALQDYSFSLPNFENEVIQVINYSDKDIKDNYFEVLNKNTVTIRNDFRFENIKRLIQEPYSEEYCNFLSYLVEQYHDITNKFLESYNNVELIQKDKIDLKPVVFVEGETDILYLRKAAKLLDKIDLIEKIEIRHRAGYANLDKIWNFFKDNNIDIIPQIRILFYDCDVNKCDDQKDFIFRRTIKKIDENHISSGIENLFPNSIIDNAIRYKPDFIDIVECKKTERSKINLKITYKVNEDEKKNFCQWVCENGEAEDFHNFNFIFDTIESIICNR